METYEKLMEEVNPELMRIIRFFLKSHKELSSGELRVIYSARRVSEITGVNLRKVRRCLTLMEKYGIIESVKGRYGGYMVRNYK